MRYERVAIACLLGAIVAYFAGLVVIAATGSPWGGMSVAFAVTVATLYAGWRWAGSEGEA